MSSPRIIVSGATTAITRRTTLRKAFLAPWDPLVQQLWLYALADAQRCTGVAVHHGICVISHHHLSVTPSSDNLPEFTRRFHHDVSCSINALLAKRRYDSPRELFDGRDPHYMRLLDAAAQASHLVYEHNNCVAAGLVERPEHMPGRVFDFEVWRKGYIDVPRPSVFFSDDRPESIRLEVTPPPLLFAAFGGDMDRLVYQMQRLGTDAARALRAVRNRPVLGARRIERLHPWSEPRTLRESGGGRIPSFRVGARGIVGRQDNIVAAVETHAFRCEHREARVARHGGDYRREFPYGSYEMRVLHGAKVPLHAPEGAFVCQPGPLLCDVEAQLQLEPQAQQALLEQRVALATEIRNAFAEEAADICERADLDIAQRVAVVGATEACDDEAPVVVRHRFDKGSAEQAQGARRVVTLRDRRRGRPPGKPDDTSPRGADPPA